MVVNLDTKHASVVQVEVEAAYDAMFPRGNSRFVGFAFSRLIEWFGGKHPGYLPIDVSYHDLEHTLQGVLCIARLLHRRHCLGLHPILDQRCFELGILAMLMHDTGYLKKRGDIEGSGAKYTLIHVDRSQAFAAEFMAHAGYSTADISAVQSMIRCTGLNVKLDGIPFNAELERLVGYALGTADFLGQMAAPDYVDKLPILYTEFAETARFNPGRPGAGGGFESAEDLMRKTPAFWEKFVLPKLEKEFGGLYRVLNDPYPDGPNPYVQAIEGNIVRLRALS